MASSRSRRGFGTFEAVTASLIAAVTIGGAIRVLVVCYSESRNSQMLIVSTQIAKGEIERAKAWGYTGLPTGTVTLDGSGKGVVVGNGTWVGAFDATANSNAGGWVTGGTTYYTMNGVQTTSTNANAWLEVSDAITDTSPSYASTNQILPTQNNGTVSGYTLGLYAIRQFVVRINNVKTGANVMISGTQLVTGGL